MGKYLWLCGGLAFLAALAFAGWHRSLDHSAETEETEDRPAAAAPLDPKRETHVDQGFRSEPPSKSAQSSGSAVSRPSAVSRVSDMGSQGAPGQADMRWLAAAGLPEEVRRQLASSDDPRSRELLRRNGQLAKPREEESWSPEMQQRLDEFFESRAESGNMIITVACGEQQCQVQMMSVGQLPAGSTTPSQALFDALRQQWWFQDQLTLAQDHVTTVNGRLYHLQYFDRNPR